MSVTISVVIHIHIPYFNRTHIHTHTQTSTHSSRAITHIRTYRETHADGTYKHFYDTKLMAS